MAAMKNDSFAIINVNIVNEDLISESDVIIRDGRISQIGSNLSVPNDLEVIDANGKYLLPGQKIILCKGIAAFTYVISCKVLLVYIF